MAKKYVRENVPLSRFGVLVAQLESIVASAAQQPPESILCFDLLSDLISAIDEEPKESILLWQRKCEDALYSLLILGARRPVRHLASLAMARIISKGDGISIYSRASSLQGLLSDGKRSEPLRAAGAAQCLGELYHHFGRRITSGLLETTNIAAKLMKFNEDFVRQEALEMLQNALEGSGGTGASAAYTEAFRLIMRIGVGDKSFIVRIAAARCLKTFASIGGPGLGVTELENSASYCVKALEDPTSSVRDAFAEALGAVLALGMNPEAQVQPRGKGQSNPAKKLEGCLQKHLTGPFMRANGVRFKDVRLGLTLSWVFFLQAIRLKYLHPDSELPEFAFQVMDMLRGDSTVDAHALACVLYILRVGVTDQMTESTQRNFLVLLGRQLESPGISPSMEVAALRTLSFTLTTLGEVPSEFKEILDNTIFAALSHSEALVRIEAAMTLRALAEVDPTCVGGLISYAVTTLTALRENISFEKGSKLKVELDSLLGQATVLAALVSISPKLPLGYPAKLPKSVLDVSKKMLTEYNRNPVAATAENEAGWLLIASLIASMPKEELEDQVFDILALWATPFSGNDEYSTKQNEDLASEIRVWSAAVDALTAFIRCFISPTVAASNNGILLQPVLVYLGRALSYISALMSKQQTNVKSALDLFAIRTLIAYQSLPDPMAYRSDHSQIIQICTTPFRDPSSCEESSCLRLLLDKRDVWLGPWIPGRDWFEDELRAFQGGKDGLLPCVWESEHSTFPQPETISKMLVNQMLLCFGILFATQDSTGMLSLLGMIEQSLKAKKQSWHSAAVTNACVGLLSGLKVLLALRPQPLGIEILSSAHGIFQGILGEGDICASQRRASSEGLGLLARLGNDIFTARMTRGLLGDLVASSDLSYTASIALSLGCIHRSAGGMALSTLVPTTVSSISSLAKSSNAGLKIWSLHGLLLTIEAAGLTYVSQVQATLLLAMEILLTEENGWVDLRQGIGRLINAIVAVLGPELAPGSIFFSRCKSVVAEISSGQATATLLESVRFTQQLVLFAPQAVSMHSHVQTLLPTLSSRQPVLRHLAVSTLRHLIEKDPVAIIDEKIEENLFHMFDEEPDSEIGNLVRNTITRLLYTSCPSRPSHWISICRNMVLAVPARRNAFGNNARPEHEPGLDGDGSLYHGEDDENMVSSAPGRQGSPADVSSLDKRDNHLRYRTRVFAAECLSHVPAAVGKDPAHFDLSLAREISANGLAAGDWLILQIQELIALAYQISTMQFENMQPIGVELLSTILDKFEKVPDPDLPGHFLMEQYQAQLVSAIRTALNTSSGPLLLEAGLHLATKILTSSITSGDQVAVKRIFSLISRPLSDFKDLYYPSFAEWVACKIKVRLLAAHASVKCYTYAFLRRQHCEVRDEYLALVPQFSKASNILGKSWMSILKDYSYACFGLQSNKNYRPFLEGIQSPLVLSKLQPCLEDAWPVILQAITLDAVPVKLEAGDSSEATDEDSGKNTLISGCRMVELDSKEFHFLWGFALLVIFQGQHPVTGIPLLRANAKSYTDSLLEETSDQGPKLYEIAMLVLNSLSTERFFSAGFLTLDICRELLQVFAYSFHMEDSLKGLVVPVISQIVQVSPESFFETEDFVSMALELCVMHLYKIFRSTDTVIQDHPSCTYLVSALVVAAETLIYRSKPQMRLNLVLACLVTSYNCLRGASTESCLSKVVEFVHNIGTSLKKHIEDKAKLDDADLSHLKTVLEAWLNLITTLIQDCIKGMYLLENRKSNLGRLLQRKLAFCLEQAYSIAKLAHETRNLGENNENSEISFTVYRHSTKCIHTTLTHSNTQVQTIGLQVLKGLAQRELGEGSNIENHYFFMFFTGELFGDIFNLVHNMLKKPMNQESVAITSECLRLLVLLQALSKVTKCQKGLINLFLEAVIMVVSAPTNDSSQEMIEIRSITLKLVSHLAQIPSSAVHFKDVLLTMPVTHRQQLQDIIRASVTMDTKPTQSKSTASPLTIKLPVQIEQSTKVESKVHDSASSPMHSEGTMEEEDDWDAFQSFDTADDTAGANKQADQIAVEPELAAHPSVSEFDNNDEFKEFSSSQILKGQGSPDPQFEGLGGEKAMQVKIDDEFHEYSVALKEVEGCDDLELEEGGGEKANQLETDDDFQKHSNSPPLKDLKETRDPQHQEGDEERVTLTKEDERDDSFQESHMKDVEEIHDAELEIGGGEKTMVANLSEREDGFEESSLNDVEQIDESLLQEVAGEKEILVNEGERDDGSGSSDLNDVEQIDESLLQEVAGEKEILVNEGERDDGSGSSDLQPLENVTKPSDDHLDGYGDAEKNQENDGQLGGHDETEMNQESDVKAYPSHETLEETELSEDSFGEDHEGTISSNQASEVDLLASLDPKPLEATQGSILDLHVEGDGKESLMGQLDSVSGLDEGHAEGHDDTEMNPESDVKAYPSHETLEQTKLSEDSFGEDHEGTISRNQANEVDLLASLDPKPLEATQGSILDLHVEGDGKESLMGRLDSVSGLDEGHAEGHDATEMNPESDVKAYPSHETLEETKLSKDSFGEDHEGTTSRNQASEVDLLASLDFKPLEAAQDSSIDLLVEVDRKESLMGDLDSVSGLDGHAEILGEQHIEGTEDTEEKRSTEKEHINLVDETILSSGAPTSQDDGDLKNHLAKSED